MTQLNQLKQLLKITGSHSILRRYFVVNGFDGALTMLGLIMGFVVSSTTNLSVIINACLGAAIALCVSGVTSAYISEQAERQKALAELEKAMLTKLDDSAHGEAARWVPLLVALVNGLAPFLISLLIIMPLWLSHVGVSLLFPPLYVAGFVAVFLIFLLGVFLGVVAASSWFISGIKTLAIATLTLLLIYLFLGG